jgi:hypothetical protein
MVLSAAQMAAMSRLLDEALPLDAAGRRRWLEHLPPEHAALADVLHAALMQSGSETSGAGQFATLPKIGSAPEAGAVSTSDEIGPYRLLGSSAAAAWARCGWLNAPTARTSARSR